MENGKYRKSSLIRHCRSNHLLAALHYGQAIFEGIKAYKNQEGESLYLRPYDNFKRFNISAERMQMPQVPEEIFIEGMRRLIDLDKNWIPAKEDYSLYIRPVMFATDTTIGVKPSDTYKFLILLSPTGPYYASAHEDSCGRKIYPGRAGWCRFCKECRKLWWKPESSCRCAKPMGMTRYCGQMLLNTNGCRKWVR